MEAEKYLEENKRKIGDVIYRYNSVEKYLNDILLAYFKPQKNRVDFNQILLNGSVIGFGQKVKIISNLINLDKKTSESLRRIMSIRNGVAHNIIFNEAPSIMEIDFSKPVKLNVMNSSGQLKNKILVDEIQAFYEELNFVVPRLMQKIKALDDISI